LASHREVLPLIVQHLYRFQTVEQVVAKTASEEWKALAARREVDMPVLSLRRYRHIFHHMDVTGPYGEVLFKTRVY